MRILEIQKSVYENNDREADKLRAELSAQGKFLINLMSSPGAGKTTSILRIIEGMPDKYKIGVMEADIDSAVDAEIVAAAGALCVQLHTGGMCHLDAGMTRQGIEAPEMADCNFIVLENVGNLVCPAEFDTGAHLNAMILSVPEGDDKPLKYPLMFEVCDLLIINKIDAVSLFDFDFKAVREHTLKRNPDMVIFEISAKTGQGIDAICEWLDSKCGNIIL